jgi:hypothetical protein
VKKIISWLLVAVLAIGMCSWASADPVNVLDFEDGVFAFLGVSAVKPNADAAASLEVVDYNGSKALRVAAQGIPYVALNLEGLAGEKLADVAGVSFDIGVDKAADGKFYAVSGVVYSYTGENADENKADWSVYMEKKNPRNVKIAFKAPFVAGAGNYVMISREDQAGGEPATFYLDNIQLLDAEGNAIALDPAAVYVAEASERDLSNLVALTNAVEFPDFHKSAGAWAQDGLEMPQEIIDALVPGSVVEITYSSEDGDIWLVMPWATAGWMRVSQGTAAKMGGKAYITYEEIAALCGEDKSTWGAMMQCEGSSPWEVYGVRVGQKAEFFGLTNLVEFPGFTKSAGAWAQDGLEMPQEIIDALVPGSVVTISYESEDGSMWLVMPWAAAGWMRVGNDGADVADGKIAQVTYEQIEALCGEDKSTWGAMMQCESSSAWNVYAVAVGQAIK